jgi:hypothetical protein
MSSESLSELKVDIALQAKKGVGFIWAGGVYWGGMTGIGYFLSPETAALLFILGMGIVFPLAFLFSKLIDASVVTSDHPLSSLGGQIAALNGLFLPVMIVVYVHIPAWTPFTMAVLGGAHFLPYGWLYDSTGYVVLSLGVALGSTVAAFALAQYGALEHTFVVIPILGVITHAVSSGMVWREVSDLRKSAGEHYA